MKIKLRSHLVFGLIAMSSALPLNDICDPNSTCPPIFVPVCFVDENGVYGVGDRCVIERRVHCTDLGKKLMF